VRGGPHGAAPNLFGIPESPTSVSHPEAQIFDVPTWPDFERNLFVLDIVMALVIAVVKKKRSVIGRFFLLIVGQAAFTFANDTGEVSRISVHQVKALLGQPETVIIDVRNHRNWWRSSKKIPSAVREDPSTVEKWIPK
jgi:hypothetical protein